MIWTWADGHPYDPYSELSQPAQLWTMLQDVLRSSFGGADTKVPPLHSPFLHSCGSKTALQATVALQCWALSYCCLIHAM